MLCAAAAAVLLLWQPAGAQDPTCWSGGVTPEVCCDLSRGPQGNVQCWDGAFTFERCCGATKSGVEVPALVADPEAGPLEWPQCVVADVVLRHAGEHAIFTDMSTHGHAGCFQNNCQKTDKFKAEDRSVCARLCAELDECTHWSYGPQDDARKCFLRKSDGGREQAYGWNSGVKACAPPAVPDAFAALTIAESTGLRACDGGKSEKCPDLAAAINTWRTAIKHLIRATQGRVDEATMGHVNQISADSDAFKAGMEREVRPSEADFPRVVFNNRIVFDALKGWLDSTPKVEVSADDASLPNPIRNGKLCGKTSCYEL